LAATGEVTPNTGETQNQVPIFSPSGLFGSLAKTPPLRHERIARYKSTKLRKSNPSLH
jgi:hypothetical protein